MVRSDHTPRLHITTKEAAAAIRWHIRATATRRSPQAVMKISGGGRGMTAIAAHFRYISRNGLEKLEDDRGLQHSGSEGLRELRDQWRHAGTFIPEVSTRREAINLVLSSPAGTDPQALLRAARAFARTALTDHRYVMALHTDRDHPHVHLTVRLMSTSGKRLQNWTHKEYWRRIYAGKLREQGVDVEATRQCVRGENRNPQRHWKIKASRTANAREPEPSKKSGDWYFNSRSDAALAWGHMMHALKDSEMSEDRELAESIGKFVRSTPFFQEVIAIRSRAVAREQAQLSLQASMSVGRDREWTR
ncbi:relaxase/mobilization nuclease domain protein [Ostertagia ostertagi]